MKNDMIKTSFDNLEGLDFDFLMIFLENWLKYDDILVWLRTGWYLTDINLFRSHTGKKSSPIKQTIYLLYFVVGLKVNSISNGPIKTT